MFTAFMNFIHQHVFTVQYSLVFPEGFMIIYHVYPDDIVM